MSLNKSTDIKSAQWYFDTINTHYNEIINKLPKFDIGFYHMLFFKKKHSYSPDVCLNIISLAVFDGCFNPLRIGIK